MRFVEEVQKVRVERCRERWSGGTGGSVWLITAHLKCFNRE